MPKAIKEKKRLHAPAVDFPTVKQEQETDYDIHLKNLETIQSQLPPIGSPKQGEGEGNEEIDQEPKLTKEEKRKQRRDRLLKKLNHTSQEIQKKKDQITPKKPKKKTEAETPLGLMTKDLLSTLLEAEEQEERAREKKRGDSVKVRAKHLTEEERQNLLKKEVQQFTSVIDHPVFQANPLATIKEHLTNSIALQKAKDTKSTTIKNNKSKNNDKNDKNNKKKPLTQQTNEKRKNGKNNESNGFGGNKLNKNMKGVQKIKKQKKK